MVLMTYYIIEILETINKNLSEGNRVKCILQAKRQNKREDRKRA